MAIQQKNSSSNPRSTVGTTTEIYDYMRLLWARIGHTISPKSGEEVIRDSAKSAIEKLYAEFDEGTKFYVLFPIPDHPENSLEDEVEILQKKGLTRLLSIKTEQMTDITADEFDISLLNRKKHRVLVDRLK